MRKQLVPLFISVIWLVIMLSFVNWGNKKGNDTLTWDAFGYYLYLPAYFIYDDLKLENTGWIEQLNAEYEISTTLYQYARHNDQSGHVIKYSAGTAIVLLPGFLIAHELAPLFEYNQDGLSKPYQVAASLSYFVWLVIGVFALNKLLSQYFEQRIVAFALLAVCFSTNLYTTAVVGVNTVHCILFGLNMLILQQSLSWSRQLTFKKSILLGLMIGFGVLLRPSNAIIVIIPAVLFFMRTGSLKVFIEKLLHTKWKLLLTALVVLVVFSVQMLYWRHSGNNWLIYSYTEGFDWLTPYLIPFLFSFKKGWFVYTPVMIFSFVGFILYFRKRGGLFRLIFGFALLSLYMYACWETWWFGGSFSQRPMAESMGFWCFGFAAFFDWLFQKKSNWLKGIVVTIILGFTCLNLFQSWQYYHGIIDPERMTKAYYSAAFLKTTKPEQTEDLLEVDRVMFTEVNADTSRYKLNSTYTIDLSDLKRDNPVNRLFKDAWAQNITGNAQGKNIIALNPDLEFTPIANIPYHLLSSSDHFWLKGTIHFTGHFEPQAHPFALVGSFYHRDRIYQYAAYGSDTLTQDGNDLQKITFWYITPHLKGKQDGFQFYFWNYGKGTAEIHGLELEIWEPKRSYVTW